MNAHFLVASQNSTPKIGWWLYEIGKYWPVLEEYCKFTENGIPTLESLILLQERKHQPRKLKLTEDFEERTRSSSIPILYKIEALSYAHEMRRLQNIHELANEREFPWQFRDGWPRVVGKKEEKLIYGSYYANLPTFSVIECIFPLQLKKYVNKLPLLPFPARQLGIYERVRAVFLRYQKDPWAIEISVENKQEKNIQCYCEWKYAKSYCGDAQVIVCE